tara:strand:+ start:518 stop:1060 length:543 start_codon:yes stop_codon:yes gene_type:complete
MSNLRLINETNVSSFVNTVNITDIFSANFDIYKIVVSDTEPSGVPSTDVIALYTRFINASGSVISASNYDRANLLMKAETTFDKDTGSGQTFLYARDYIGNYTSSGSVTYIFNPYSSSSYTFMLGQGSGGYATANNKYRASKQIGVLEQNASMTGINLYSNNSSYSFKALIRTYGLRVDS